VREWVTYFEKSYVTAPSGRSIAKGDWGLGLAPTSSMWTATCLACWIRNQSLRACYHGGYTGKQCMMIASYRFVGETPSPLHFFKMFKLPGI